MGTDAKSAAAPQGLLARLMGRLRTRLRKLFGKKDEPNIYPFF